MNASELIEELPSLSASEREAVRTLLNEMAAASTIREIAGSGTRPPGYAELFGCMENAEGLEIPERHRWRPAPRFD